jgi:CheY-like chemotaxis protein
MIASGRQCTGLDREWKRADHARYRAESMAARRRGPRDPIEQVFANTPPCREQGDMTEACRVSIVGETGSAEDAIELAKHIALDVAVVDVLMPTMSGISLTSQLFELQPQCRVLGLSVIDEPGLIADRQGGTIDVASPGGGQGTTFTVRIPAPLE